MNGCRHERVSATQSVNPTGCIGEGVLVQLPRHWFGPLQGPDAFWQHSGVSSRERR
jgi:hypothetical protein